MEQPVKLYYLRTSHNAKIPTKFTYFAAGFDLCSAQKVSVGPSDVEVVSTDLIVIIPKGCYGRIAPRSGLAARFIDIGAGVVDSDYRGIVKVVIYNFSKDVFEVNIGDRIAQLICTKIEQPILEEIVDFSPTERGDKGFGSSNV